MKRKLPANIRQKANGIYEARKVIKGKTIYLSNKDLEQLISDFEVAKVKAQNDIMGNPKITLDEWFDEWFETYKVPVIKESSINPMKGKYTRTFGKTIGRMKLCDIRNYHIQQALKQAKNKGVAVSTLKESVSRLSECLQSATNNLLIPMNPCFDIIVPWETQKKERRFLSVEEQNRFIEIAKTDFGWYYPMLMIMFQTGLRVGEVGGLKWQDIDFDKKVIHIQRALRCDYYNGVKTEKLTSTKTLNSVRDIPFLGNVEEMFKLQLKNQKMMKRELGSRWRSDSKEFEDIVFTTSMGSLASRYIVERVVNKVVAAVNLQENYDAVAENRQPVLMESVHPHAIRRTFCTRCFEADMNPKVVQKLMGHATYSTTIDIYTDVMKDKLDYEVEKFSLGYDIAEAQ